MKLSEFYMPTLKEDPSDTEIPSHALSLRAGLIRKIASGVYSFLPMGLKVLRKIEEIIREEMDDAGAIELLLPVLQPSNLWEKSGRWNEYGPVLFRLEDRNDRYFCLGPTHEELITYLAYLDIKSYKDLPVNLYQIQVKFRDEIRPRYGLLRTREFIMKDAYSFSANDSDLDIIYRKMHDAYCRILGRIGLKYRVVAADTGLIGGDMSHEFIVLAENGEENIVFCPECGYSENYDMAKSKSSNVEDGEGKKADKEESVKEVHTPGITGVDELAEFLKVKKKNIIKTIVLNDDKGKIYAFLVRGDRELNLKKAENYLKKNLEFLEKGKKAKNLVMGYIGPKGLDNDIELYADNSVKGLRNFVTGANKKELHLINVNYPRDFKVKSWGDFAYPARGDTCIKCGEKLEFEKGMEIGHIFKLGCKYSEKMDAKFLDVDGKLKPLIMGCYGIGVSRIIAAAIEQMHDDKGIIWPDAIVPYMINVITTTEKNKKLSEAGDKIYKKLKELDIDVLYDDRNISAGIKFKDSDLIGIPIKFIIGKKFIDRGLIDIEYRKDEEKVEIPIDSIPEFINKYQSLK
ncbi:MAG: proline--tRNA ligase [Actinomycetota bacterium]|nr:proline--tRNA ligase [Actinomycetota bacterium]